jgi:hypothetical protein
VDAPTVWVTKDDGSEIIRADTIVGVDRDYSGNISARLAGAGNSAVTLVVPGTADGPHTPIDFHRQLVRMIAELSHAAEAIVVRPASDEQRGWQWVTEPL